MTVVHRDMHGRAARYSQTLDNLRPALVRHFLIAGDRPRTPPISTAGTSIESLAALVIISRATWAAMRARPRSRRPDYGADVMRAPSPSIMPVAERVRGSNSFRVSGRVAVRWRPAPSVCRRPHLDRSGWRRRPSAPDRCGRPLFAMLRSR